jgi:hypothetical protein
MPCNQVGAAWANLGPGRGVMSALLRIPQLQRQTELGGASSTRRDTLRASISCQMISPGTLNKASRAAADQGGARVMSPSHPPSVSLSSNDRLLEPGLCSGRSKNLCRTSLPPGSSFPPGPSSQHSTRLSDSPVADFGTEGSKSVPKHRHPRLVLGLP